jgi:hypothetical protein
MMGNCVFLSATETVSISFGVASAAVGVSRSKWRKDAIVSVFQLMTGAVVVRTLPNKDFLFSFNGLIPNTIPVDSVDGVVPTDNNHLFELISAIAN